MSCHYQALILPPTYLPRPVMVETIALAHIDHSIAWHSSVRDEYPTRVILFTCGSGALVDNTQR